MRQEVVLQFTWWNSEGQDYLYPKFQMRHEGFHFMASESQIRELTQIKWVNFAGLAMNIWTWLWFWGLKAQFIARLALFSNKNAWVGWVRKHVAVICILRNKLSAEAAENTVGEINQQKFTVRSKWISTKKPEKIEILNNWS